MVLAERPIAAAPLDAEPAVVFIDRYRALVARMRFTVPLVETIEQGVDSDEMFLGRVAHEIADCDRVVMMGPESVRLAFEREYVGLSHRPDRFVEIDSGVFARPSELLDRLRLLTA